MGQYSIGEALKLLLEKSRWAPKVHEVRIRDGWNDIVGKTIAKYTRNLSLNDNVLTIYTDVAALKQEILFSKQQLIDSVNEFLGETVVKDIVVR